MKIEMKGYDTLTKDELYEIYQLRVAVFVVEQKCPYQEVDQYDQLAYHVYFREEGKIIAYLRVLPPNSVFDTPSIGRVISIKRRQGIGTQLLKVGIEVVKRVYGFDSPITIEAQVYAKEFYEKVGFVQTSEEFLEDGIPHIQMQLNLK